MKKSMKAITATFSLIASMTLANGVQAATKDADEGAASKAIFVCTSIDSNEAMKQQGLDRWEENNPKCHEALAAEIARVLNGRCDAELPHTVTRFSAGVGNITYSVQVCCTRR